MIGTVLVICLSIVNIVLWVIFFAAFKKTFSPEKLLGDIRQEVDKLLIEISREADADITLLEERRRGLKVLLDEADRRILLSETQQRKTSAEKKVLDELHKASEQKAQTDLFDVEVVISEEARSRSSFFADKAVVENVKAVQIEQNPVHQKEKNQPPAPQVLAVSQKMSLKEQINELHHAGLSIEQISARLHITKSAVELAIAVGG